MASHKNIGNRLFKKYGVLSAMAIAAAMSLRAASADTFYWVGAAASWTGTANWATSSGDTGANWSYNAADTTVIFDKAQANAVTVQINGVPITCGGIQFLANNYTIGSSNSSAILTNLGSSTPFTITMGSGITSSMNGILASTITSGLLVTGPGNVTLGNSANAFSGGILITGGASLSAQTNATAPNFLGDPNNSITINTGSSLIFGGSNASALVIPASHLFFLGTDSDATGNGTLSLTGANKTITIEGVIANTDSNSVVSLTYLGATNSNLILTGANTYNGKTILQGGGTLTVNTLGNVGSSTPSSLGCPTTIADGTIDLGSANAGTFIYTGTGSTTDRVINLTGGSVVIDQSGTGLLKFTGDFTAAGAAKALTLRGSTSGIGEIAGAIVDSPDGATSVTKSGTGTWVLSGANNTYTGNTSVALAASGAVLTNPGTLVLDNGGSAASSNFYVGASGSLVINSTTTAGTTRTAGLYLTRSGAVTLNGNDSADTTDFFGSLDIGTGYGNSGANSITVNPGAGHVSTMQFVNLTRNTGSAGAGGTLLLSGPNIGTGVGTDEARFQFSGTLPVTITPANLGQPNASVIPYIFVADTATGVLSLATYDAANYGIRALANNEYSAANTTVNGQNALITGAGELVGLTPNSLTLSSSGSTPATLTGAGTMRITPNASLNGNATVILSTGSVPNTIGIDTLSIANEVFIYTAQDLTISSEIIGGGGVFNKSGPGNLTLNSSLTGGTNTFTANASNNTSIFKILEGTVTFYSGTDLGADSNRISIYQGATLHLAGDQGVVVVPQSLNGPLSNTNYAADYSQVTIQVDAGSTLSTATVTTTNGYTKTGPGTLRLTGSPSTNNGTAIAYLNEGSIVLYGAAALGAGGIVAAPGTTVGIDRAGDTTNLTNAHNVNVTLNAATLKLDGTSGYTDSINALTLGGASTVNVTEGTLAVTGVVADAAGATGSIVKTGTGTLVLSSASSTYTGTTTINGGTISIGADRNLGTTPTAVTANNVVLNGGTLSASATFALSNNRGMTLGASGGTLDVVNAANMTYGGTISGGGSLTKTGAGVLTLTGSTSDYTGVTTISAGTLALTGSGAIATSPKITVDAGAFLDVSGRTVASNVVFTVPQGQTIGGLGTVTGHATAAIVVNGTLAPGAGTLSFTGAGGLTLSDGATLSYIFNTPGTSSTTSADSLNFGGTVTLNMVGGTATFASGGDYVLFSYNNLANVFNPTTGTVGSAPSNGTIMLGSSLLNVFNSLPSGSTYSIDDKGG
ncbi:MAG: autotransporter-associated beta strand repeat-containing protein, partial [Phycisphaerales bacterium]|nr:autotransporter-associated beta strand repeat-containing protein [Phycisphaerales bacterium]